MAILFKKLDYYIIYIKLDYIKISCNCYYNNYILHIVSS